MSKKIQGFCSLLATVSRSRTFGFVLSLKRKKTAASAINYFHAMVTRKKEQVHSRAS